jgi:hypothetical protein
MAAEAMLAFFARRRRATFYLFRALAARVTPKFRKREFVCNERLIHKMNFGGWSYPRFRRVEFYLVRCLVTGIFRLFSAVIEV